MLRAISAFLQDWSHVLENVTPSMGAAVYFAAGERVLLVLTTVPSPYPAFIPHFPEPSPNMAEGIHTTSEIHKILEISKILDLHTIRSLNDFCGKRSQKA